MNDLCLVVQSKISEQIERAIHLAGLVPPERLHWKPDIEGAWPVAIVLGHILDCAAGLCAALAAAEPERLAHFAAMRNLAVNHACTPEEAIERLAIYRARIDEAFGLLNDAALAKPIVTVFVAGGEPLLTLLLGNLEHLINHKHQLFTYLKQMGVNVGTADLYRFR